MFVHALAEADFVCVVTVCLLCASGEKYPAVHMTAGWELPSV